MRKGVKINKHNMVEVLLHFLKSGLKSGAKPVLKINKHNMVKVFAPLF
jgi:hypothetical protein